MFRQSVQRLAVRHQSTVAKSAPRALSNSHVGNLSTRWETLPKEDQTTLIEELKSRMEGPWQELTPAEKKAAYYISFGEWGPRRPLYQPGETTKIFWGVIGGLGIGLGLFAAIRQFAADPPITMNREWQTASDEYLKSKNANPFSGYSQIQ
ncbi:Uncharacterized protein ABC855_g3029 [[Candida] zeylanoides]|jgi:cytochrome c oxidase subunit 4